MGHILHSKLLPNWHFPDQQGASLGKKTIHILKCGSNYNTSTLQHFIQHFLIIPSHIQTGKYSFSAVRRRWPPTTMSPTFFWTKNDKNDYLNLNSPPIKPSYNVAIYCSQLSKWTTAETSCQHDNGNSLCREVAYDVFAMPLPRKYCHAAIFFFSARAAAASFWINKSAPSTASRPLLCLPRRTAALVWEIPPPL